MFTYRLSLCGNSWLVWNRGMLTCAKHCILIQTRQLSSKEPSFSMFTYFLSHGLRFAINPVSLSWEVWPEHIFSMTSRERWFFVSVTRQAHSVWQVVRSGYSLLSWFASHEVIIQDFIGSLNKRNCNSAFTYVCSDIVVFYYWIPRPPIRPGIGRAFVRLGHPTIGHSKTKNFIKHQRD